METTATTDQPRVMGTSQERLGVGPVQPACQFLLCLSLAACGSGIKPVPVASDDSASPGATGEDTADTLQDGADGDGGEGGDDGDDGGSGGTGASVSVEATIQWRTRTSTVDVCTATLTADDVPASWSEWGAWTDIDPALAEPAPDPLPDPIPASVPVGQGTSAGHGSWRFSLDATTDANFADYAALAEAGGDHRLVCVLARGSEAIPHSLIDQRPLPALDGPLSSVDVLLRVIWSD